MASQFTRRTLLVCAGISATLPSATYPQDASKPVRLVVPFPAGSAIDATARLIAPELSATLERTVVVDNIPGANGNLGAEVVAKALPDGTTLGLFDPNIIINPLIRKASFDALKDFTPIGVVGATQFVLVVNNAVPATNAKDFIDLLKGPGVEYKYGSSGNGTITHIAMLEFLREAKVNAIHIPYRGTAPMLTDLLGGNVQFCVVGLPAVAVHIKSGKLKAIGLCGTSRSPSVPTIPTIKEQGFPNYNIEGWATLAVPSGTAADQLGRLQKAFVKSMSNPSLRQAIVAQGNVIVDPTSKTAATLFQAESTRYSAIVRQMGLKAD
jgi:tripartite-type tricarboxylate transporter receptor subunit TctC